ncbi:FAD-dependent oxidoreductase [Ponticoccus sp. SC2-23]|uniref:NAD(P)/FAD-dependent oxidoreductase n=1 Tax=Alexandriicola marinus TaxID=2081710 RepID=UPI000FD7CA96|nr:FAD-dependent oxidoreductase [Alexandriicola marinus]MBM1220470.1 FAD-dependent oxidoreductase [Ponticoccus sp. SC6-9]MBM1225156.1 FAD-dependent oxidoreductase [Ponticoccus sp. SC6-15]MBM1228670.1 FAD-dependent oxidoreductase [Ponticoccus sp. SC6-38]MBM1233693.1 FAD-dependent oxidoreductase [Ponticoccus sp. SC6-45]MBM1239171.1 FAD-dependent oxidoreductase [Ponticoccus sp. SC6-49]MBM1242953.1 FAD-dependent oxidoreductase [Ponticoccus sp. SC2-64]MBM1247217.1 FAD-dependent oxidoreductase [Po
MNMISRAVAPKKIAVIGAGIAGMSAAYKLSETHEVTLIESERRLGGHARTKMGGPHADQPVDTGFIVFNYVNYPHLTALFSDLDVPVVKSNMSFGASFAGGKLEYALANFDKLFAQRRNLANPKFLRMCRDILRFNARAADHASDPTLTIGELIERLRLGSYFRDHYLLPFSGAIWSTPTQKILDFPAYALVSFFQNHGLMDSKGQHQWFTVDGGSVQYVSRLGLAMTQKGVKIRLGCAVNGVRRTGDGVEIRAEGDEWERFDEVVFATHSDISLKLLSDPSEHEAQALGAIRFQPNDMVLHSDPSVMPKARKVWSSWCYAEGAQKSEDRIDLSYWMNSLQPWLKGDDLIVTLNSTRPIREDLIWDQATFQHPVFDAAALQAQRQVASLNGTNRTWFCGAWMKNGFHEDGIASAVDVVAGIGGQPALAVAAE